MKHLLLATFLASQLFSLTIIDVRNDIIGTIAKGDIVLIHKNHPDYHTLKAFTTVIEGDLSKRSAIVKQYKERYKHQGVSHIIY